MTERYSQRKTTYINEIAIDIVGAHFIWNL